MTELKCDCGGHKCGVPCYDWCQIEVAARAKRPKIMTGAKAVVKIGGKTIEFADVTIHVNPAIPYPKQRCSYEGNPCSGPCQGEVELRPAMTAYCYDAADRAAGKPDPNPSFYACESCHEAYTEFWQEQWDEYYSVVREGLR